MPNVLSLPVQTHRAAPPGKPWLMTRLRLSAEDYECLSRQGFVSAEPCVRGNGQGTHYFKLRQGFCFPAQYIRPQMHEALVLHQPDRPTSRTTSWRSTLASKMASAKHFELAELGSTSAGVTR
jgi:hypothetical protein